jgi:hypothetical protein
MVFGVLAVGAVASLMRMQQTGARLPGALANLPDICRYAQHGSRRRIGSP